MIFTSNFKIAGHLPQAVAICQGLPRGWNGRTYKALAPSWALIKAQLPIDKFTRIYKAEVLDKLNPHQVLKDLGHNVILLCWEKPGEPCHRRVVAVWLEANLGIQVPEFNPMLKSHQKWLRKMQEEPRKP